MLEILEIADELTQAIQAGFRETIKSVEMKNYKSENYTETTEYEVVLIAARNINKQLREIYGNEGYHGDVFLQGCGFDKADATKWGNR
jgi:hypothetical protein